MVVSVECSSCKSEVKIENVARTGIIACPKCGRSIIMQPSGIVEQFDEELSELLLDKELITRIQLKDALCERDQDAASGENPTLSEILVKHNLITRPQLQELLLGHSSDTRLIVPGYEIVGKLGGGGMGTVYHGIHSSSGKRVAIKVLADRLAKGKNFLERFKREAHVAMKLDNPHIVKGYDVGEYNGKHYFVMEYVHGKSAERVLVKRGRFGERRAMDITRQIAEALQYAHGFALIHRDIKPGNIVLTKTGYAKLADYGLVKITDDAALMNLTASGQIMGTPYYLSPEQAGGLEDIDVRSDIYSLGATLYHLVTGVTPYAGKRAAEVIVQHLCGTLVDPRERNPELSGECTIIINKMLARERNERYQSPAELLEVVENYFVGLQVGGDESDDSFETDEIFSVSDPEDEMAEWFSTPGDNIGKNFSQKEKILFAGVGICFVLIGLLIAQILLAMRGKLPENPWRFGKKIAEAEALLKRVEQGSGSVRSANYKKLAREYTDTEAGSLAKSLLAVGLAVNKDEAAAAKLLALTQVTSGKAAEDILRKLVADYAQTLAGKIGARKLKALNKAKKNARVQLEVLRKTRQTKMLKRQKQRNQKRLEEVAKRAFELVLVFRDKPLVFAQKLQEFSKNQDYSVTTLALRAKFELQKLSALQEKKERQKRLVVALEEAKKVRREVIQDFVLNKPDNARERLEKTINQSEFDEVKGLLMPFLKDCELLDKYDSMVIKGLRQRLNKQVRLAMKKETAVVGKLKEVYTEPEPGFVIINKRKRELRRRVWGLKPSQQDVLVLDCFENNSWQGYVLFALKKIAQGKLQEATLLFKKAGAKDPDYKHHQDMLLEISRMKISN